MAFRPEMKYDVEHIEMKIVKFHLEKDEFRTRPPYQRKSVWSRKQQQSLLDSLIRRSYVPSIVLRLVDLPEKQGSIYEVIDGQQRITTVQKFFDNEITLPTSLRDLHNGLPKATFLRLPEDVQDFVKSELYFLVDIIEGIDDPLNHKHHKLASDMFWRLQQGVTLNTMEKAHAKLSSLARNFIVKYSDDYDFDFEKYEPIEENQYKHQFFKMYYGMKNDRMQHLKFLGRILLIERAEGPIDTRDNDVEKLINETVKDNGVGNIQYENEVFTKQALQYLDHFCKALNLYPHDIPETGISELKQDFFSISFYLLLRFLVQNYRFERKEERLYINFLLVFHRRFKKNSNKDESIQLFAEHKSQTKLASETRLHILLKEFVQFAENSGHQIKKQDGNTINLETLLSIYDNDEGVCRQCVSQGVSKDNAVVPFIDFLEYLKPDNEAGIRILEKGYVLCLNHNLPPEKSI